MTKPKTTTVIRQLGLSETLAHLADKKAARLGITTPEYIRHLIVRDNESRREFISPEAEQEYLKNYREFLEEQKVSPTPGATTADELLNQLDRV